MILSLNPPGNIIRTGRLVRQSKIGTQSWMPIMLGYSVAVLEKLGYECRLYDASVLGWDIDKTVNKINNCNPELISFYWSYDTRETDLFFAEKLAKKYRVVLVGPWSAHYPEALKDCPSVEAMTFGQFEYTLPKLIEKREVMGVTYQDGLHIPQRDPYNTQELDWMPFVTSIYKEHLNIPAYHQTSFRHPFVDLFTARSCPYRCAFCSWTNGGDRLHPNRYQKRSLRSVMDELWFIKNDMPWVKQIFLQDSTLITPRAIEISQEILDEKLKICWGAYSRADKDYETLKLMSDAGCRTLHVGYEFPIQSVLDEIRKDITVEQLEQFAKDIRRVKMWTSSSFMIFPWNTEEQIKYMVDWIKKIKPTRVNVAQLQPYPNIAIMDVLKAYEDMPGKHLMTFDEMVEHERRCFSEFYIKNPSFWWNVITNPSEWKNVCRDAFGMFKFLWGKE